MSCHGLRSKKNQQEADQLIPDAIEVCRKPIASPGVVDLLDLEQSGLLEGPLCEVRNEVDVSRAGISVIVASQLCAFEEASKGAPHEDPSAPFTEADANSSEKRSNEPTKVMRALFLA